MKRDGPDVSLPFEQVEHRHTLMTTQVLTGSNSPHQFPGESGAGGRVLGVQTILHEHQHDQQSETKQTQDHIARPGLWDLVECVVNLQEELVGNALKAQNVLQTETTGLTSAENINKLQSSLFAL